MTAVVAFLLAVASHIEAAVTRIDVALVARFGPRAPSEPSCPLCGGMLAPYQTTARLAWLRCIKCRQAQTAEPLTPMAGA